MKDLLSIQKELKAPKSQYNSFGRYSYRSAEDILEAVKPLLVKAGALLTISDDVTLVGDRIYVVAEAKLVTKGGQIFTAKGWAREDETKKGFDGAMLTGATSSYARKYALNGLFCIDDTKDNDQLSTGNSKPLTPVEAAKQRLETCRTKDDIANVWRTLDGATKATLKAYVAELGKKVEGGAS